MYKHKNTALHLLDARIKLVFVFLFSLSLFFVDLRLAALVVVLLAFICKIPLKEIAVSLKPFLFIYAFILLMYYSDITAGLLVISRFILLVVLSLLLLYTTTISQLLKAFEKLFLPLKYFGINIKVLSLLLAITIRFIPLMKDETMKIKDAQMSRGASQKKISSISLLLDNSIKRLFKRASSVADAVESRNYPL